MSRVVSIYACVLILIAPLISGCSSTFDAYRDTFQILFSSNAIDPPSIDTVKASSKELMLISFDNEPKAVLVREFSERNQDKWLSADAILITMQDSLIIATSGLNNDLIYTSNIQNKPSLATDLTDGYWRHDIDVESLGYGISVVSKFSRQPEVVREYYGQTLRVIPIEQQICIQCSDQPGTEQFKDDWVNYYWLDAKSGDVLSTRQKLYSGDLVYEIDFLSTIVRRLETR